MSTKITIEIVADEAGYTAHEAAILDAVRGTATPAAVPAAAPVAASKPAPAAATTKPAPAASKPAPKAEKPAPATTSAQSTKAAVLDETIDEPVAEEDVVEEAEVEDDLLGGGTTFTKAEAIAAATKLVSTQKQSVVKAALAAVGAKRVSDLNDDADIQTFMAALEA